jgi:hypothetical protein
VAATLTPHTKPTGKPRGAMDGAGPRFCLRFVFATANPILAAT